MNVLIIGSGGREHALAWKLKQSPKLDNLFCAPGNPGIALEAECVPVKADDILGLMSLVREKRIDLTIVGPERPLAAGLVDRFQEEGLPVFGPTRGAAELEWSKAFAKAFMQRHNIPTAEHRTFAVHQFEDAITHVSKCQYPVVVKADGLAAGKGVVICETREQAQVALRDILEEQSFGSAGNQVVVEEFLEGEEVSVFAICDGERYIVLPPAQDHKRSHDNDEGLNTGGMGAYAPAGVLSPDMLAAVEQLIIRPTINGLASEGRPYKGCLYVGLMLTRSGPKVVEYNCRFGDPETQVVLPLLSADLLELLTAAAAGSLIADLTSIPARGAAVCVILASGGYPGSYSTGKEIKNLDKASQLRNVHVFHAGTTRENDVLVTAGGRVLGVTAVLPDASLSEAIKTAYEAVNLISFEGMHFRTDIGRKALH